MAKKRRASEIGTESFEHADKMLDEVRAVILSRRSPKKHEVHYVISMLIMDLLEGEPPAERARFLEELRTGTHATFALMDADQDDGIGAPVGEA